MKRHLILLVSTLALLGTSAFAQTTKVPAFINYQGNVRSATGTPLSATRTVTFRFYKSPTSALAADRLWSESQSVTIVDGNFSVLIGGGAAVNNEANTGTFAEVFGKSTSVYLSITVDDGTSAVDPEISPRQQIVTTAYAFRATVAEGVDSAAIKDTMIAANAVTTTQLNASAVTAEKIATSAVTTTQILDGSITSADIADKAIVNAELGDNAVTTDKIADGTITSADIAPSTIALASLVQAVRESLVPAGTVVAYGGDTAPTGWVMCDGAALSRTAEPALFNAIGTRFGAPLGTTTTFNVPDLRGRFIRGWNALQTGEARDPDASAAIANGGRKASMPGGDSGDKIGSLQFDDVKAHTHPEKYQVFGGTGTKDGGYNWPNSVADTTTGPMTQSNGILSGKETRPANVYLNYIIKK